MTKKLIFASLTLPAFVAGYVTFHPGVALATPTYIETGKPQVPGSYTVDPAHTSVGFQIGHLGISQVQGRFTKKEGKLLIGKDPTQSSVEMTVQTASVDTAVEPRDNHLRSPDFFDVENHPTLSFRSTEVVAAGSDGLKVTGDLSIRDVTKPITLDVKFEGTAVDPWGGTRAIFSAATELAREEWGITWNAALEAGGVIKCIVASGCADMSRKGQRPGRRHGEPALCLRQRGSDGTALLPFRRSTASAPSFPELEWEPLPSAAAEAGRWLLQQVPRKLHRRKRVCASCLLLPRDHRSIRGRPFQLL